MSEQADAKHIKLTIQYDGSEYSGWQVQPNEKTIQGVLESELEKIAPDRTRLVAAGRTDAGVHAIEQVASFRTSSGRDPAVIKNTLNALLPPDIRITDAAFCSETFHPRYDAKGKRYTYIIFNGPVVSPFVSRYAWHVRYRLNVATMKRASALLTGEHDFSSFQASGCSARNPVRNIHAIEIKRARTIRFLDFKVQGDFILIALEANAFLRHMVRNIVGTLTETGRGRLPAEDIKKILSYRDRTFSGPTAPPGGLFLQKIYY
jgi:tRNA pseudouridine38-40 synthase